MVRLAPRFPPLLRRWREVFPEDAARGATPHRRAKDASLLSLSGLSPTATSKAAAVSVPTPRIEARAGAASATRRASCASGAPPSPAAPLQFPWRLLAALLLVVGPPPRVRARTLPSVFAPLPVRRGGPPPTPPLRSASRRARAPGPSQKKRVPACLPPRATRSPRG